MRACVRTALPHRFLPWSQYRDDVAAIYACLPPREGASQVRATAHCGIFERKGEHMFAVRRGKRYRATISLGMLERLASNHAIAAKLRDAGFSEVAVTGSGATRMAEALWSKPDATAEMPNQIARVVEV